MTIAGSDLAVIGLGPMGRPIARRLIDNYGAITVWNRTARIAEGFSSSGATIAKDVTDAAAPVVITVLPDLPQVEMIAELLLAGWAAHGIDDPILVVHGTVSPAAVAAFASRMADDGVRVIDAPVSGGTIGACEGRLSIMVGGEEDAARFLEPVFSRYATTVRYFGPSGSGALAKLCNQIVVASTVAALAEAAVLAERGGLDLAVLFETLSGGLADSEVLQQKGPRFLDRDFVGGGSAQNQLKDMRHIAAAAADLGVELPLSDAVTRLYQQMVDDGYGSHDHSGVMITLEKAADSQ